MSNFFNQDQISNITLVKENNIENVNDFSRANLNTKLGDLPQYEDLYKKEIIPIKTEEISSLTASTNPIANREFKKQEDKEKALLRARVKIFLTVFTLITMIVTVFVIYNLITTIRLNNKVENNDIKIKAKREQIEQEEEQPATALSLLEIPSNLEINIKI